MNAHFSNCCCKQCMSLRDDGISYRNEAFSLFWHPSSCSYEIYHGNLQNENWSFISPSSSSLSPLHARIAWNSCYEMHKRKGGGSYSYTKFSVSLTRWKSSEILFSFKWHDTIGGDHVMLWDIFSRKNDTQTRFIKNIIIIITLT